MSNIVLRLTIEEFAPTMRRLPTGCAGVIVVHEPGTISPAGLVAPGRVHVEMREVDESVLALLYREGWSSVTIPRRSKA